MLLFTKAALLLLGCQFVHAIPSKQINQATSGWSTLPALGQGPRQEHSVVALEDKIYVLGGTVPSDSPGLPKTVDTVEYYSLSDNSWHSSNQFLQPLNHLNAAVVSNKIYILGGLEVGNNSWDATDISMVYSPVDNTWEPIAPMPQGTARGACAVGVYHNKVYLAGGMTFLNRAQDANGIVTAYDTITDSWDTSFPPLPQTRQHVGGAVVGSTFYVLGGRTDGQFKIQGEVFALDLESPQSGWREMASMPTARGGLACIAIEEHIYCFGGEGNPNSETRIFAEVEAFDTMKNEWSKLNDMPVPRHGWGVAAIGGSIYVPGGGVEAGTAPTDHFSVFTP